MNASTSSSIAQPSPGPWTAFRHERDETDYTPARIVYTIEDANGTRIASAIKHDADARLIAAAPELLAALKDLVADVKAYMEEGEDDDILAPLVEQADRAIAKAEGRDS